MAKSSKNLVKLIFRFGLSDGIKLYFQFLKNRLDNIKLQGIKHSFALRPYSSDTMAFNQVFYRKEYKIPFPAKSRVIIDGGANIGLFSIKAKNDFPEARIISVEPDPENFQMLERNLKKYDNVFLENRGLWKKDTKLKVYDKYNNGKWGMIVEEDLISGSIGAISMNSLFQKYAIERVDILKLDIEASEKQVFAEHCETWLPKVKMVLIELHDRIDPECSKNFFAAINKSFKKYTSSQRGENIIITNMDID